MSDMKRIVDEPAAAAVRAQLKVATRRLDLKETLRPDVGDPAYYAGICVPEPEVKVGSVTLPVTGLYEVEYEPVIDPRVYCICGRRFGVCTCEVVKKG